MLKRNHLATFSVALTMFMTSTALHAEDMTADVVHVFTTAGEQAQVDVLRDAFAKEGGRWRNVAVAGSTGPLRETINRILAGDPPSAAQFSSSQDYYDLLKQNMLVSIDEVAAANNWRQVMPQAILDAMSYDGKIYLAPVALNTPNWLWYNVDVLKKAGVEPPTRLDDSFFKAMDKVKAAGYIPFALSGVNSQLRFIFEAFLIDAGGKDFWNAVWRDKDEKALRSDTMRTVFERFRRVKSYADAGSAGRAWNQTLDLVVTDKAAFDILGDWAMGTFKAAGLTLGKDFGCVLAGNVMIIHADLFGFPKQGDNGLTKAQAALAKSMMEADTQRKFSLAKGSIPPRKDVDIGEFNACAKKSYEAFNDPNRLVGQSRSFISPPTVGEYLDLLIEYMDSPEMTTDDAVDRFAGIILSN